MKRRSLYRSFHPFDDHRKTSYIPNYVCWIYFSSFTFLFSTQNDGKGLVFWFPFFLFYAVAFEVFYRGSWKSVERLRISDGTLTLNFLDMGYLFEQKGFLSTLRLRPRRATMTDCTWFLRPGVEISVYTTPDSSEDSSEECTVLRPYSLPTSLDEAIHGWKLASQCSFWCHPNPNCGTSCMSLAR